ncbi:MAG TPA: DinB family protein [Gemmatimonadales bacterium]|nr:DinB family protein [Gemmatimonadales bacterium]
MPLSQMMLHEFDQEMVATRKMLERVPDGNPEWRPHDKSMTLGRLATHVAELPHWTGRALMEPGFDVMPGGVRRPPLVVESTRERLALFDQRAADARATLAGTSDDTFNESWSFIRGGTPAWTATRYYGYRRMMQNHLIHHRAQLGVYLRQLGVPIPGMYGPSADEM